MDTAFPGAYRRELFALIGGFDETLVRNQDDDLHLRARLAGHPMWFEPRLRSTYRPRRTLGRLWSQYYQYGWWRAVTDPQAPAGGLAPAPGPGRAGGRAGRAARCWPRWPAGAAGWPPERGSAASLAWAAVLALAGWRERGAPRGVAVRDAAARSVACTWPTASGSGAERPSRRFGDDRWRHRPRGSADAGATFDGRASGRRQRPVDSESVGPRVQPAGRD